jgi:hypothetical protein
VGKGLWWVRWMLILQFPRVMLGGVLPSYQPGFGRKGE